MSNFIDKATYISAGDMSSDVTGGAVKVTNCTEVAIIATVSSGSSPVGSLIVQVSNDNSTWVASSATSAVSADGSTLLSLSGVAAKYIRLFYDVTSGSGTLNASCFAKA